MTAKANKAQNTTKRKTKKKNLTLTQYRARRKLNESPEPKGAVKKAKKEKKPIFVIQKHDASHLHYDLRLEIKGVLVSWAVPKGLSDDPEEKRLAIRTDNHPLEYADFEGTIPEGHYGAGSVKIWDRGTYQNIKMRDKKKELMEDCLKNGQIEVAFKGKKIKGNFVMIRFKTKDDKEQWLIKKMQKNTQQQ